MIATIISLKLLEKPRYTVNIGCMDSVEWNGGMEWWNGLEWTGLEWTGMEWNDRSTNFVGVAKLCPRQFQYPIATVL